MRLTRPQKRIAKRIRIQMNADGKPSEEWDAAIREAIKDVSDDVMDMPEVTQQVVRQAAKGSDMGMLDRIAEKRAARIANRRDWTPEQKNAWLEKKNEREGLTKVKKGLRVASEVVLTAMPFGLGTGVGKVLEKTGAGNLPVLKEIVEENKAILNQVKMARTPQWLIVVQEVLPAIRLFQQGKWTEGVLSLITFLVGLGYLGPKVLPLIEGLLGS